MKWWQWLLIFSGVLFPVAFWLFMAPLWMSATFFAGIGGLVLAQLFCQKFSAEIRVLWLLYIWPAFSTASVFIFFFVNIVLGWAFGDGFLAPMVISYWNITSEGFIVFWRIMCVLTSILYLELFWIGMIAFFSDKVDWD